MPDISVKRSEYPFNMKAPVGYTGDAVVTVYNDEDFDNYNNQGYTIEATGGSRRRRPSRKYKKSAKRVFRKKSRSTRRR